PAARARRTASAMSALPERSSDAIAPRSPRRGADCKGEGTRSREYAGGLERWSARRDEPTAGTVRRRARTPRERRPVRARAARAPAPRRRGLHAPLPQGPPRAGRALRGGRARERRRAPAPRALGLEAPGAARGRAQPGAAHLPR